MAYQEFAYILCLKYSPGLKKEFVLLGESIKRLGVDVEYLVARDYKKLPDGGADEMKYLTDSTSIAALVSETIRYLLNWSTLAGYFTQAPPRFVCCYSFHPLNMFVLRYIKTAFPNCDTAIYMHEPPKPDKRPYGIKRAVYIYAYELLQSICLRYTDHVILPSEIATERFTDSHGGYNGNIHYAPLLVPNFQRARAPAPRRFFTYVGIVHAATGFDVFIDVVNHVASTDPARKMLAITPSDIKGYLRDLSSDGRRVLTVINKQTISDEEIDSVVGASIAVLRLDSEITQSGVVPVSFKNGSPVIARNLPGFTQHVEHGHNGYVLPTSCSPEDILDAMDFVQDRFPELSQNARESFEHVWAERNWPSYYEWLANLIAAEHQEQIDESGNRIEGASPRVAEEKANAQR